MSSTASDSPLSHIRPRSGIVKALGICNVVFSVSTVLWLFLSISWLYIAMARSKATETTVVAVDPTTQAAPASSSRPTFFNIFFVGMDNPKFVRFTFVNTGTALLLNGLMFATGIGLINLKRWAALWWTYLAWIKIVRLWVVWGYFIVAVTPSLSEEMARAAVEMLQQAGSRGRLPSVGEFTRIYAITNLFQGIGMIVFGSIYPAISLWLLGRPSVKAALIGKISSTEARLP
jgi:hypothetical protein